MTRTKNEKITQPVTASPSRVAAKKIKITKDKVLLVAEQIEPIEKNCVLNDGDFVGVTYNVPGYSSKYLRDLFTAVVGMSIWTYVRRRRLTEAYYSIEDFENQVMSRTVGLVTRAKRKIIDEFGNPPTDLQQKLDTDTLLAKWGFGQEASHNEQGVNGHA